MRKIGFAILGLTVLYIFIHDRSAGEAAVVLTSAAGFYAALLVFLLRE